MSMHIDGKNSRHFFVVDVIASLVWGKVMSKGVKTGGETCKKVLKYFNFKNTFQNTLKQ